MRVLAERVSGKTGEVRRSGTDFARDPALVAADVEHGLAGEEGGGEEGETGVAPERTLGVVAVVVAKDGSRHEAELEGGVVIG